MRDVLRVVADEVVISVAKDMSVEYSHFAGGNVRIVEDMRDGVGPIEGLLRALSACKGKYVVVAPCDTPFLRPAVCRMVAEAAYGHDGAVPIVRGYVEPLHGAFERLRTLGALESQLAKNRLKLQDAWAELELVRVPEERIRIVDPMLDSFWNLNTAAELHEAEMRLMRRRMRSKPS